MPASTLDPVNAAIRNSLSKAAIDTNLDIQLAGATKKALLEDIEFEAAGSYQSTVLDKLKTKYIVLKSAEPQQISVGEKMGADETLKLAKHVLFSIDAVQLGWIKPDWGVGAGMVNMGNTCYLNSTLQALFHVPALVNWLVSEKHTSQCEDSGGLCIICAMRKTLQDSQQRNTNSIRPFLIYNKLRVVCRNMIPGRQEDAHEFLRYLVEAMEKAYLSRFKNHTEFDSRTKETTPLNQILGGYLRSAVRCLECSHVSTTFQHFQDLLLDIRKSQTLEDALDGYFSREKLDDESYHCESCQKKVPATKQFSLERAPMVLCIQLKRFSVSNNKITKHVQFRQRLELTKFARHRTSMPLVYRFVALVTHMGPTVGCGHYTAVAQGPCGNYYQFDDSMVRPISHQAVFNTNAYIMLYELECPPFLSRSSQNVAASASKMKSSATTVSNSTNNNTLSTNKENATTSSCTNNNNNKLQLMNGSRVVYGPELPPKLSQNGIIASCSGNGNKSSIGGRSGILRNINNNNNTNNNKNNKKLNGNSSSSSLQFKKNALSSSSSSSSSSSDSDSEQQQQHESPNKETAIRKHSPNTNGDDHNSKSSPFRGASTSSKIVIGGSVALPRSSSKSPQKSTSSDTITASSQQLTTKLVPYDVDDDDDEDDGDNEEEEEEGTSTSSSCSSDSEETDKTKSPKKKLNITIPQTTTTTTISSSSTTTTETTTINTMGTSFSSNVDRIATKATCHDWQVTSSTDGSKNGPSNDAGKSWTGKELEKNKTIPSTVVSTSLSLSFNSPINTTSTASNSSNSNSTVNELLKMSHGGYSAPVSSWNGTRARLEREINDERREDRKRSLNENMDQGRVKHPKVNNENGYKSNPGYNRVQEYHNAQNSWNQNNNNSSSNGCPPPTTQTTTATSFNNSRQFYNTSGKHRNRRHNNRFHHKNNYHHNNNNNKNTYSFRQ